MPSTPPTTPGDPLRAEQAYLHTARAELARMREHTRSLESQAGDAVSGEYLAGILWQRAQSLIDDPRTALFFGRLDTADPDQPERWYIGRRHVSDESGNPVVVDWRAPISTPFYRASGTEPMGIWRRRRFGIDHGSITAYEDEVLTGTAERPVDPTSAPDRHPSQILAAEIERPRIGPMRDIVATIQPEQDQIVRADVSLSICVQGAPGTGKTAVGLHRAAWLLYSFRERLSRQGVLVIGPNRAFLEHVGAVLPALGELRVRHTTAEGLTAESSGASARGSDTVAVAALKGDPRMAAVLRRAVWSRVAAAQEALVVPRGSRRWRVPAATVQDILDELSSRGVRYSAARAMLPQRLAHAILVSMERSGDSPDDRVHAAIARSAPVKAYVNQVWPALQPTQVLFELLADPGALRAAAEGILAPEEQSALGWDRPARSKGSARWSPADLALLDEVSDLLERLPRLGHVILDEAQDLSPMQLRAVGRRAETGSMTVLGDIAQGTTPWATGSWQESLEHLGQPEAHIEVLTRGFRVPAAVISLAARLLPAIAPDLDPPESVRSNPGRVEFVNSTSQAAVADAVLSAVRAASATPGTVGVIAPDTLAGPIAQHLRRADLDLDELDAPDHASDTAAPRQIQVVRATTAKGLEFDQVIVIEPARIAREEGDQRSGLRRLYVVLTRAVSSLTVVHAEPLPVPLQPGGLGPAA